ncbi:MAG: YjjG family noncanonical pyrimidine nucleotidase [Reichenbachiella sp.]
MPSKNYSHIFFDLDHTLWDYDKNAEITLSDLFDKYELKVHGVSSIKAFLASFMAVNEDLWSSFNGGKIDKFYLRNERFRLVFEAAGANMEDVSEQTLKDFNRDFLRSCPKKGNLMKGVREILEYLKPRYQLNIITNGFEEVQSTKLESAGIHHYFDKVITSEKAGFKKPFAGIFYYAMKHCNAQKEHSIMIGDNLFTDIKGARDYEIDQVFYNPNKVIHKEAITYEITMIDELKEIL